jgi:2-keto-4-pentenoate hydratase/2-oxohepta-3-ene-1,7-dioic acid hydratase in catechol pathway
MEIRRFLVDDQIVVSVRHDSKWIPLNAISEFSEYEYGNDVIRILDQWQEIKSRLQSVLTDRKKDCPVLPEKAIPILPFEIKSFRDFMLSEKHAIDAARGIVKRFLPSKYPVVKLFEMFHKPFPMLTPKPIWYRQPIYYTGNHLHFVTNNAEIEWPLYTKALDYELELGFVITKPLKNAGEEEALSAIGGFVVVNDFSARDVQLEEMQSGLGPQKSKHFATGISAQVIPADEVLPHVNDLRATVKINGKTVCNTSSKNMYHSLADILIHVSKSEQLYPGELFATGTMPGGCALENDCWLKPCDEVELWIERIGTLTNIIGKT